MTNINRHLESIEAALEKLGSIELEKATPDWRGESQVLKDARNSINAIYDIHPTLHTTEYDANTLAKTILMHASFDFEEHYIQEVERITKIITDALLAAKQSTQINDGVLNDRYQNGAGLMGGTDIGDGDLQAALNYWGDMDYKNGCEFAQYILLTYRKRFDELLTLNQWLPIDDKAKNGGVVLLFSPHEDGRGNCKGGWVWISGGYGRAAHRNDTFRGEQSYGEPSMYLPFTPPYGQDEATP